MKVVANKALLIQRIVVRVLKGRRANVSRPINKPNTRRPWRSRDRM